MDFIHSLHLDSSIRGGQLPAILRNHVHVIYVYLRIYRKTVYNSHFGKLTIC